MTPPTTSSPVPFGSTGQYQPIILTTSTCVYPLRQGLGTYIIPRSNQYDPSYVFTQHTQITPPDPTLTFTQKCLAYFFQHKDSPRSFSSIWQ